jgi:4a-hydroxytetrahydrobiopterin dehydratase
MGLSGERCEACRPNSPMVSEIEAKDLLRQISAWEIVEIKETQRLRRTYVFDSWMAGVRFAERVGEAAEESDHHPSILIVWGKVTVTWWTHAIGGLHRNDFIMAARSDELAVSP